MSSAAKAGSVTIAREVWWLRPHTLVAFGVLPVFALLFALPTLLGQDATHVRFRIYFGWPAFWLGASFFAVLAASAWLFSGLNRQFGASSPVGPAPPFPARAAKWMAALTLAAYAIGFRGFLLNPGSAIELFTGGAGGYSGHLIAPKISGVTTLTQLGVVYVTVVLVWRWVHGVELARGYWLAFWAIVALTGFRAFAWTERLALIELVSPIVVLFVGHRSRGGGRGRHAAFAVLPVVALFAALAIFGVTEYFRSWASHYQQATSQSLAEFTARRFLGYYYTSLNNGAGYLAVSGGPDWSFSATAHWLRQFPLGVGAIFSYFAGESEYGRFLVRYADPEFSNASGVFSSFSDLGVAGALWYAAIWGGALGYWYADFVRGRGLGLLMFPVAFVSLPESLRLLYLSNSRAFLIVLGVALVHAFLPRIRSAHRTRPPVGRMAAGVDGQ